MAAWWAAQLAAPAGFRAAEQRWSGAAVRAVLPAEWWAVPVWSAAQSSVAPWSEEASSTRGARLSRREDRYWEVVLEAQELDRG